MFPTFYIILQCKQTLILIITYSRYGVFDLFLPLTQCTLHHWLVQNISAVSFPHWTVYRQDEQQKKVFVTT